MPAVMRRSPLHHPSKTGVLRSACGTFISPRQVTIPGRTLLPPPLSVVNHRNHPNQNQERYPRAECIMKIQASFQILTLSAMALSAVGQNTIQPRVGNPASGEAFFRVDFPNVHGNGRSCATCHVPEEAFQLTPDHVEARYQALQARRLKDPGADDP